MMKSTGANFDELRVINLDLENGDDHPFSIRNDQWRNPNHARQSALNSVVRINANEGFVSGVIVSKSGWILTCAHHLPKPKERVKIELMDGRTTTGQYFGVNPVSDIAVLKITGESEWPFVPIADSSFVSESTPIWFIGYGIGDPTKYLRETSTVSPSNVIDGVLLSAPDCESVGGDSGGGVFDNQGRLIGIHRGRNNNDKDPGRHTRIELFRIQWKLLTTIE